MKKEKHFTRPRASIKMTMILSYIFCAIIPLVIVNLYSSNQSKVTVRETTSQLAVEMVKQTSANTNYFIDAIEKTMTRIIVNDLNASGNKLLHNYVQAQKQTQGDKVNIDSFQVEQQILKQLNYSATLDENVEGIAIVFDESDSVITTSGINEEEIKVYKGVPKASDVVWNVVATEDSKSIFAYKDAINMNTGKRVGVLVVKVKYQGLEDKLSSINLVDGSTICLIDGAMETICSNTNEAISKEVASRLNLQAETDQVQNNKYLLASAKCQNGWCIVSEIPKSKLTERIDRVMMIVWVIILIVGALAVLVGDFISHSIIRTVTKLKKLMKQAEGGDFTVHMEVKGKNELDDLGRSFNHMIANIKVLIHEAQNTISSSLEAAASLKGSTTSSIEGFSQLSAAMGSIAEGANLQTEDIKDSVSTMEQLDQSIQSVMENTAELLDYTKGSRKIIDEASKNMTYLNTTVEATHKVSTQINSSIIELNHLTRSIGDVMELLDQISERTNLLALNASIEAARAGEVGKGFAVVADEVRKLAMQSKDSAGSVREALGDIEKCVAHTTKLVNKSTEIMNDQEMAVSKSYHSLEQMISDLTEMNKGLEQVDEKMVLMSKCKDDMTNKTNNISSINEGNVAAIEQVNALSQEQLGIIEQFTSLASSLQETMSSLEKSVATFVIYK